MLNDYKGLKLIASSNPHIRNNEDTRSIMLDVIIALCPALILRDLPCQAALRRPWQELLKPRAGRPCRARRVLHEPDDLLDRPGLRQGTALRRR